MVFFKKRVSMNNFCKQPRIFAVFFSVLLCTSIYSEWSCGSHVMLAAFTHEPSKNDFIADGVHSNFSHGHRQSDFRGHGLSVCANNFEKYTAQDFQHHFARSGYVERKILHQRCLYMHDAFVKYAQTYSGYKDTIQKLYAELKNLNVIQKAYCVAKGTYCRGLQDRIAYLYKQLNTIKAIPQDNNFYKASVSDKPSSGTKVANFDLTFFSEQFAEYKVLESIHDVYLPCLAKAINARSDIYRNSADRDFVLEGVSKSYNLNRNVKQLLSHYGHELTPFAHCSGNQLQQVIHQESLDILDRIDTLPHDSLLYDHQEALVNFAVAMADYNHAGLTDKAMTIGDLCWTLLDYGQAIAEGAALGVYSAARDILTNPIEATVCLVAGKQVLAYQLCKVLYNVADIGVTAIYNFEGAKEKWNKYAEPLNNIIDAINKKEIMVRDAIKGGTAFIVGYKAQGKLLSGVSKFCTTIKHKSISFVENNLLLNPQWYLTTPEGFLFKATAKSNKSMSGEKADSSSGLKKIIEDKISHQNSLSTVVNPGKSVIRQGDLRAKIQQYDEHIFSKDHKDKGILTVGENKEAIMDSLCENLLSLDKKGYLREGNNQLRVMINGIDNIEVRCFIRKGEVIGINAFISNFGRVFSNFVDARNI